eukprot:scaffold3964_cov77-Skeletonema_marinoi.AAC.1
MASSTIAKTLLNITRSPHLFLENTYESVMCVYVSCQSIMCGTPAGDQNSNKQGDIMCRRKHGIARTYDDKTWLFLSDGWTAESFLQNSLRLRSHRR